MTRTRFTVESARVRDAARQAAAELVAQGLAAEARGLRAFVDGSAGPIDAEIDAYRDALRRALEDHDENGRLEAGTVSRIRRALAVQP